MKAILASKREEDEGERFRDRVYAVPNRTNTSPYFRICSSSTTSFCFHVSTTGQKSELLLRAIRLINNNHSSEMSHKVNDLYQIRWIKTRKSQMCSAHCHRQSPNIGESNQSAGPSQPLTKDVLVQTPFDNSKLNILASPLSLPSSFLSTSKLQFKWIPTQTEPVLIVNIIVREITAFATLRFQRCIVSRRRIRSVAAN